MSHKVHPKIFRAKTLKNWHSRWLDTKNFPFHLEEDFIIREFLNKKLRNADVENIEIERFSGKINVIVNSARPGIIIGRGGEGVERLKKMLEEELKKKQKIFPPKKEKRVLNLEIREVKNPWLSASIVSQWVAERLEKRIPFRRVMKQTLEKVLANKEVRGAKIEVAGRLDGTEIARTEWLKKGRLPRQTIKADIDYSQARAYCTYGVIGIKVWIYKGEKI